MGPAAGMGEFPARGCKAPAKLISLLMEEKMFTVRDLIPWNRGREIATGRAIEHPLLAMQREMDRLFEELCRGVDVAFLGRSERASAMLAPRIEMREAETEVIVTAELPGMSEANVDVTLTDNVLTIRGEKKGEASATEAKEGAYTYSERAYGAFERRISLEADVVADKVSAEFSNGVLTVRLPKNPQAPARARRIPIGCGGEATVEHKAA